MKAGFNLYLFHIPDLERFFGNKLAIFRQFLQGATDYLDARRQTVDGFYEVKLKNAFFIQVRSAFQLIKNSSGKFPLVTKKEFAEAFKPMTGLYI